MFKAIMWLATVASWGALTRFYLLSIAADPHGLDAALVKLAFFLGTLFAASMLVAIGRAK